MPPVIHNLLGDARSRHDEVPSPELAAALAGLMQGACRSCATSATCSHSAWSPLRRNCQANRDAGCRTLGGGRACQHAGGGTRSSCPGAQAWKVQSCAPSRQGARSSPTSTPLSLPCCGSVPPGRAHLRGLGAQHPGEPGVVAAGAADPRLLPHLGPRGRPVLRLRRGGGAVQRRAGHGWAAGREGGELGDGGRVGGRCHRRGGAVRAPPAVPAATSHRPSPAPPIRRHRPSGGSPHRRRSARRGWPRRPSRRPGRTAATSACWRHSGSGAATGP